MYPQSVPARSDYVLVRGTCTHMCVHICGFLALSLSLSTHSSAHACTRAQRAHVTKTKHARGRESLRPPLKKGSDILRYIIVRFLSTRTLRTRATNSRRNSDCATLGKPYATDTYLVRGTSRTRYGTKYTYYVHVYIVPRTRQNTHIEALRPAHVRARVCVRVCAACVSHLVNPSSQSLPSAAYKHL